MVRLLSVILLVLLACDDSRSARSQQHSAVMQDLAGCVGHFMADAHNLCAGEFVGKARDPASDGFVAGAGGPTGDEPAPSSNNPLTSPEDCESLDELEVALQAQAATLSVCLAKLGPAQVDCSFDGVSCPPILSAAECNAAMAVAGGICGAL